MQRDLSLYIDILYTAILPVRAWREWAQFGSSTTPFLCVFLFFPMLNGFAMLRTGWYMPWFLISMIFITLGVRLMYGLINMNTSNSAIYGFSVLLGIGTGATCQAAYSVAPAKVAPSRMPDAVGYINSAQIGGMTIVLAISSTIF
jgi:hypothetical protein